MNSLFIRNRDGKLSLMLRVRRDNEIDLRLICRLNPDQAACFAARDIAVVPSITLTQSAQETLGLEGKTLLWGNEVLAHDLCKDSLASLKPLMAA